MQANKCPVCRSRLWDNHREGWPTAKECPNPMCRWTDPVKFTAEWISLQKQEDIKAARDIYQQTINFIKGYDYGIR